MNGKYYIIQYRTFQMADVWNITIKFNNASHQTVDTMVINALELVGTEKIRENNRQVHDS